MGMHHFTSKILSKVLNPHYAERPRQVERPYFRVYMKLQCEHMNESIFCSNEGML